MRIFNEVDTRGFSKKKDMDMNDLNTRDVITDPPQQCMGLPAVGTSVGVGATFGVSVVVSGAGAGVGALIAVAVFAAVESVRKALWKRTSVAFTLEARLMDAIQQLNLNLKIKKDFEENLNKLKDSLKYSTLNNIQVMDDQQIKAYYYKLKLGLDYEKITQCLDRIRDQAVQFNQ